MKTFDRPPAISLCEWIVFPELGMVGLHAKIDVGASTSSLHASDIVPFKRDGEKRVHSAAHLGALVQRRHCCEAPMVACKTIRNPNGRAQTRYVIHTTLALGDRMWPVELALACRKSMCYYVLLGSKALTAGQLVVSPALAYIQDRPKSPAALSAAAGVNLFDGSPVRAIRRQHLFGLHSFPKRSAQCLP